mmetsp:Transcript_4202/g.5880  ORF Transcript_4202/g.5880 Transcript_4202/m.5880 type:complete len:298 (-) Transcript_4202:130-1023(-)
MAATIKCAQIRRSPITLHANVHLPLRRTSFARFFSTKESSTGTPLIDLSSLLTNSVSDSTSFVGDILKQDKNRTFTQKQTSKTSRKLSELKYFSIYPKEVRKWILDAKTPKGYYDINGSWKTVPVNQFEDSQKKQREERIVTEESLALELQRTLPADLQRAFRFGIKEDDIKDYPPKLKELLSFKYATQPEINKFRKMRAVEQFASEDGDTGSAAVQVAVMTEKIKYLSEHLSKHPKDKHSRYGLTKLLGRRLRMMKYLRRKHAETYFKVLKYLNLKDLAIPKPGSRYPPTQKRSSK